MESKKTQKADLETKSSMFFSLGLVLSLSVVVTAFEWKVSYGIVELEFTTEVQEELIDIPNTIIKPPKPPQPKVVQPKIEEVDNDEEIAEIELVLDAEEILDEPIIEAFPALPEEEVDEIVSFAESMPEPFGGTTAFYTFLSKQIRYPSLAKRSGVEGRVFVQFIVDKDGSLSDIQVVKGIGFGCDEEAERVLRLAPKWQPGKQRGRPVKVRMIIPINFRLN